MAAASLEVALPPEYIAGIAALGAIAAIDLACLRWGKATISRLSRHLIRKHPVAAAIVAAFLAGHLVFEIEGDPLRWAAGMAARQTGDSK